MNEKPPTPAEAVRSSLLRVARNVAKHLIQRAGWSEDDACFRVDLRASEAELLAAFDAQAAELGRLRNSDRENESQLVWLAAWCRERFRVESNSVIGKDGWPGRAAI